LEQLTGFLGELRLENLWSFWQQFVLEIGVKEAKLLVESKTRVVFLGHFAFSPESLAILAMRADWDLRSYRRVFRKSGMQGERTVTLERLHRNDGVYRRKPHYLRVTRRNQNGQKKITDKFTMNATNQDFIPYLEVAALELLQAGWEEI
jgi:hypothetical protein